jgi:hypothetical protein
MKRYKTQSIAAGDEELFAIAVLAKAEGLKPATAARQLLYRGIEEFLKDGKLRGESLEDELLEKLTVLINEEPRFEKAKAAVLSEEKKKSVEPKKKKGVKNNFSEDEDSAMLDDDIPDPVKITRKLKDEGVEVNFKTVVRVLSNDAPEVPLELKNKIFAAAGLPLIGETEDNGKDSKKSNGTH